MNKLILSQSGVYYLHQLANQVRILTGIRYKLSDESSRIELIRDCANSSHQVIQTYFAAFTNALTNQQIQILVSHGVYPKLANVS